jgi:hypothetical protein
MLREEHRLMIFEKRVLRTVFGPKTKEVTGGWTKCIIRSSIICNIHQILLGRSNEGG